MKLTRLLICGLVLFLVGNTCAWAWNDLGHITVAQIAFRQLSADQRRAVVEILRHHPHFDTYFRRPAGLDVPDDEWLFMRASTWCDAIRPPRDFDRTQAKTHPLHKFHRGPWHYINYPYRAGDAIGDQLPLALVTTEDEKTDAIEQLKKTREVLQGAADDAGRADGVTAEQNRAVRLCWLFHVVGDIHQPLHAVSLVDQQLFPGPNFNDLGGNLVLIRTNERSRALFLHAYWDGLLGESSGWRAGTDPNRMLQDVQRCRTLADLLTHDTLAAERLPELTQHPEFVDWAFESFQLGVKIAYDGGNLKFAAKKGMDAPRIPDEDIPVLPPILQEKARATANKRVALAGYRLAIQLQDIPSQE